MIFLVLLLFLTNFCSEKENDSILGVAKQYLGTPYVANTLEVSDEERLIVNQEEVDCTTFVEYVLAEYLANDSVSFEGLLQSLRYREGKIKGYTSRLHYFSEWVQQAINNNYLMDITKKNSSFNEPLNLHYMSTHFNSYVRLKDGRVKLIDEIKQIEKTLFGKEVYYLPKEYIPNEGLDWIANGDIIALTTLIDGLDVSHLGFAIYVDGVLRLLHASSVHKKVIIDSLSLKKSLAKNKNNKGIRVFRVQR